MWRFLQYSILMGIGSFMPLPRDQVFLAAKGHGSPCWKTEGGWPRLIVGWRQFLYT